MKRTLVNHCAAASIALLTFATTARGSVPVPITNAGFEDPALADGATESTIPNWTQGQYDVTAPTVWVAGAAGAGVYDPSTTAYTTGLAPEGENMAFTTAATGFDTGISQVLAATLQAEAQYDLSVKVGNSLANLVLTADYRIELVAGGVVVASATGASPANDTITTATLTYNSGAAPAQLGQSLEIRLLAKNFTAALKVDFDDVQLTAVYANADLSDLVPSVGTLTPAFASGTITYTATAPYATTDMTVTPTAADPGASITVNGNPVTSGEAAAITLIVGTNVITTVVTATDATTKTYTLTVTRLDSASLSSLVPSVGTLAPAFASTTTSYTATVPNATTSMTVTPTAADPGVTSITVNTVPVTSGSASDPITLTVGANVITTEVTGSDAFTKTYTLTVTRAGTGIYEPFDYAAGAINGKTGATEIGFSAAWVSTATDSKVASGTLAYSTLPVTGGKFQGSTSINRYGGSRAISASALAGMLDDGKELWFSAIVGVVAGVNGTNHFMVVALASDAFTTANGAATTLQAGQGVGIYLKSGKPAAASFSTASVVSAATTATQYNYTTGGYDLVVGKIAWGATTDTITLYKPDASMNLGTPISTLTANVTQSAFDTLTFRWGDPVLLDEIRFGASYNDVIGGGYAYWDLNGITAGACVSGNTADGTWDGTTANWNAAGDGIGTGSTIWPAGQTAVFAAGTDATGIYTVTVDGTQDIGGMSFPRGTVTLAGGTALKMTRNCQMSVETGLTATVATPLSDNAAGFGLSKIGSGTLGLSGSNAYGGVTNVYAGTLQPAATAALPGYDSANKVVIAGGTLGIPVDDSNWTTANVDTLLTNATKTSGSLGIDTTSGSRAQWAAFTTTNLGSTLGLTKLGSNTLTLDQPNTFNGPTTVTAGTLALTDNLALQNSALVTTGGGSVTLTGATPTLGGLSGGSGNLATVISSGYGSVTTLTLNPQSGTVTYGGIIADGLAPMQLIKTGAGTQALQGTNTYTGATTVSAGTLTVSGTAGKILTTSGITLIGGRLLLDNSLGNVDRVANACSVNLTLGGDLSVTGIAGTTSETINNLDLGPGHSMVTVSTPNGSAMITTLNSAALNRSNKATALVRGTNLNQGVAALNNYSRIKLTTLPSGASFVGTNTLNSGTTTDATQALKVVPWLIGDISATTTGSNFVTYDTTLGLRVLLATEQTTLAAGSTTAAEPVNAIAFGGSVTEASGITVNSLLFKTAVALDSSGASTPVLTVNSGAVALVTNTAASIGSGWNKLLLGNGEGVVTVTQSTLTINTPLDVTSGGGLTKAGTGILVLAAAPAYSGDTTVNAGTLQLNFANPNNDASTVTIAATGATLNLNFAGTDTVKKLFIGSTQMADGVYGVGNTVIPQITGTGTLTVGGSPYATWAAGPFLGSLTDPNPALDFDGGGLSTGIEWVTAGDPTNASDDAGVTPTLDNTTDPDKFLFVFRRADAANTDTKTTIKVEYGSDLIGWTPAAHQGTGTGDITITEADNFYGASPGIDKVTVAIPRSLATGSKLFARLNVVVVTP